MLLAMKTCNQWLLRFDPSIVTDKQSSIVSQICLISKKQLCTSSTLFCTFLCRCFARLQRDTSRNVLVTPGAGACVEGILHLRVLVLTAHRFHLALVAASISYFLTAATKLSCCSSNKKMSPLIFISRSRSLSPLFSLGFAGLPPNFSFCLSFSCSVFQICGHDN